MNGTTTKAFPNYLELPSRLPNLFWQAMRVGAMLVTAGLVWVIATNPSLGLTIFWRLMIPLLPATFAFAPGIWRQICPMAFVNQLPRSLGFGLERTLPLGLKNVVYVVSVGTFFGLVSLRQVFFNIDPDSLLALILLALALAFVGGFVFKGRSGWCGTFCPLAPIQRAYGHAPVVMVKNGYCPTCVGCQKNCYDFNPTAAIHSDLSDSDPWYAGHKRFFIGALPGFVAGFYLSQNPSVVGVPTYYLQFAGATALSLGCYMTLTGLVRISPYRASALFAMVALCIYYWFSAPQIVTAISTMANIAPPTWTSDAVFGEIVVLALAVLYNGLRNEWAFARLTSGPRETRVGVNAAAIRAAAAGAPATSGTASDLVVERKSGRSFAADPKRSLLEGMESAGIKLDFGCRMGMCGADPIVISDGAQNLSEAGAEELATLRRLGLEGRARMACVCRAAKGGVTIDLGTDPRDLPEPPPTAPAIDLGEKAGVKRVVIIGNGAAGMAAADEIRRASASCEIDVITKEDHRFYNRMAIGRLLYSRSALDGIYLAPADWQEKRRITLWLSTVATRIDLAGHRVILGTGDVLPYDKLILAQGGRAIVPPTPGSDLDGCFVLREAADAIAIRRYRQEMNCTTAVVLGGGVLGIEAAEALRHLNLSVTILQRDDRVMNRELDHHGSELLTRFLEGLGIRVRTKAAVARIKDNGEGRVRSVELVDGEEIPADIFLTCTGVAANVELARDAGLTVGRGVIVDRGMRTSDADVFAVGDVAELAGERSGLWAVSNSQAMVAARAVFGESAAYVAPSTMVSLKLEGIDVKGFGVNETKSEHQELITAAEEDGNTHRKLIVENGRIAGAVFVGPPGIGRHIGPAVQNNVDLSPVLDDLRKGDWDALGRVN